MSLFSERDASELVGLGRDLARQARSWLLADERRKTIGLIVASVAVSITVSLLVTAIVGAIARRRVAVTAAPETEAIPADAPPEEAAVGVPVMEVAPAIEATELPLEA